MVTLSGSTDCLWPSSIIRCLVLGFGYSISLIQSSNLNFLDFLTRFSYPNGISVTHLWYTPRKYFYGMIILFLPLLAWRSGIDYEFKNPQVTDISPSTCDLFIKRDLWFTMWYHSVDFYVSIYSIWSWLKGKIMPLREDV